MSVTAPPRPPRPDRSEEPLNREEIEALVEALIEEVRQETRRRRRRNAAIVTLVALVGAALFAVFGRSAKSQSAPAGLTARPAALGGAPNAKLAFTQLPLGDCGPCPTPALYVVNADGSGREKLATFASGDPSWSPDGRTIAFTSLRDHNAEVYVMNADGSGLRNLTRNPASDSAPVWSPDGRKIVFGRNRKIYVVNADGSGGPRKLKRYPASNSALAWSPDGRKIAFDREGSIYVMSADGRGQQRLARGAGPLWSPDGKQIAFSRTRGNGVGMPFATFYQSDIFVMNADGTQQHNVTRDRRWNDCCLAWSPSH
jgi:Tol biopolymer transport system component